MSSLLSSRRDAGPDLSWTPNIPDDILLEVFIEMVRNEALDYDFDTGCRNLFTAPARYPWTLAAVCRRWRAVTLQKSTLWSFVDISGHACPESFKWYRGLIVELPYPAADFHHFRIRLQLERSRNTPLVICAAHLCRCNIQAANWRAVLSHSERWQELRVIVGEAAHFREIIPDHTSFSSLTWLCYVNEGDEHFAPMEFRDNCGDTFLNLRSVTVSNIYTLQRPVGFPWPHITSLTLHEYEEDDFTHLLSTLLQCKSLLHFSLSLTSTRFPQFYLSVDDIQDEIQRNSVILPHLTSLAFTNSEDLLDKTLMPFLQLPSLRHLTFGFIDSDDYAQFLGSDYEDEPDKILVDLIAHSMCSLTELSLRFEDGQVHLPRLLQMMPQLRLLQLHIRGHIGVLQSLPSLVFQGDSRPCPSLEQIWISCTYLRIAEIEDPIKAIVEVVTSRLESPGTSCLKMLRITAYEDLWRATLQAKIEAKLEKYTNMGLKLQFILGSGDPYESQELPRIY